jgi:hypothetical protein
MRILLPLASLVLLPFSLSAREITVNCDQPADSPTSSINVALSTLNRTEPNLVRVSGTCNENVTIAGFDRLTLVGQPATVNDASNGIQNTFSIFNSRVTLSNLTVNGGRIAVFCGSDSLCTLNAMTIGGALLGVRVDASSARFQGCTVQNNAASGVFVVNAARAVFTPSAAGTGNTIQDNTNGVTVLEHSFVLVSGGPGAGTTVIRNNSCRGMRAADRGAVNLFQGVRITGNGNPEQPFCSGIDVDTGGFLLTSANAPGAVEISGNLGNGVQVIRSGVATFLGNVRIENNGGHGVDINRLSYGGFSGTTVSGNGGQDITCSMASISEGLETVLGATKLSPCGPLP